MNDSQETREEVSLLCSLQGCDLAHALAILSGGEKSGLRHHQTRRKEEGGSVLWKLQTAYKGLKSREEKSANKCQ